VSKTTKISKSALDARRNWTSNQLVSFLKIISILMTKISAVTFKHQGTYMALTFKTIISNAFSIILTSLILSACGGGGGATNQPTTVTITCPNGASKTAVTLDLANTQCASPTMLLISPVNNTASVSVDVFTSIDVTTDSTLDISSLTSPNVALNAGLNSISGTVSAVGSKAFKFTPSSKLNYGQSYAFSASVKDTLGKTLVINIAFTTASVSCVAPQVPNSTGDGCVTPITFVCPNGASKTAATLDLAKAMCEPPQILSMSPLNGSAVSVDTFNGINVVTDSTLDSSSITNLTVTLSTSGTSVVGTASAVSTFGFKFMPTSNLGYAQTYTFSAAVKDTMGRTLSASSTFTTAAAIPTPTYSVSGTLTGLPTGGQVSLQNNSIDTTVITANGSFTFATKIDLNATYAVMVSTQPTNYTCAVTAASGTVVSDVSTVAVACTSNIPYISVNTNITLDAYPSTYNTDATSINSDVCNIDGIIASYPKSWNGTHTLPTVNGAPLNANLLTAVIIKDILPDGSLPRNCNNPNNISEFTRTAARLKSLNVDIVNINQWHWMMINNDGSYTVTGDTGGALSDNDVALYVNAAHSVGLKVMMNNQIQGFVNSTATTNIPNPDGTVQNLSLWLTAFQSYMLNRAVFFQSLGVDFWEMGCVGCVYGDNGTGTAETQQLFASAYSNILNQITPIFKGKKYINALAYLTEVPNYINGIDFFTNGVANTKNYTAADELTMTVDTLKSDYIASGTFTGFNYWSQYGKPLLIYVGIQSRTNTLSRPGYMEETVCTNNIGSMVFNTQCIQMQTTPDFGLQAIVIEAQLETISAANLPAGSMIVISDYWQTDFMSADGPTFPDIAYSIRNKPAEGIVKQWLAR